MIRFEYKGDLSKTQNFLKNAANKVRNINLDKFGAAGVAALAAATPVDSGLTASSWYYKIEKTSTSVAIVFCNSNIQNGFPIAIMLQYGHGTRNGGWVEGRDYINPAIRPVFDKILNDVWREVTKR